MKKWEMFLTTMLLLLAGSFVVYFYPEFSTGSISQSPNIFIMIMGLFGAVLILVAPVAFFEVIHGKMENLHDALSLSIGMGAIGIGLVIAWLWSA